MAMAIGNRFPIITICGSMRYYDEMKSAAEQLTRRGFIVLMPFVADYIGNAPSDEIKEMLDEMHRDKIDLSNGILVIGEHRGESTLREINYATLSAKPVFRSVEDMTTIVP